MSASDVVTLLVAGGILYISYRLSRGMSSQIASTPASAPVGQVAQYPQQPQQQSQYNYTQPQAQQIANNNTAYAAQVAAQQAAEDERIYQEYLAAAGMAGPSWLGCA